MSNKNESISNIEKFCKKYNLESLANNENATFDDYKELLDSLLNDSKKSARNIKIIKAVAYIIAATGGGISGWQLVEGIKNRKISNLIISGVGLISIYGTAYIATKLAEKDLNIIRDNAIFVGGIKCSPSTNMSDK